MPGRFTVAPGREFMYPADVVSFQIISAAGGVSKLSPEKKQLIRWKFVKGGEDCSDMPPSSLKIFLERGWVIPVVPDTPALSEEVENG